MTVRRWSADRRIYTQVWGEGAWLTGRVARFITNVSLLKVTVTV